MQRSGTVVTINVDPEAPMMEQADIAIVGDYREIAPALAKAFQASGVNGVAAGTGS
jgi:electron transfer flavoprotein alpha subunit